MFSKIQPYHITNDLREKGWKSTEEGCIFHGHFQKKIINYI